MSSPRLGRYEELKDSVTDAIVELRDETDDDLREALIQLVGASWALERWLEAKRLRGAS